MDRRAWYTALLEGCAVLGCPGCRLGVSYRSGCRRGGSRLLVVITVVLVAVLLAVLVIIAVVLVVLVVVVVVLAVVVVVAVVLVFWSAWCPSSVDSGERQEASGEQQDQVVIGERWAVGGQW